MSKILVYTDKSRREPLEKVLDIITDDWIENGNCCDKTVMDLRDACKQLLSECKKLEKEKKELVDVVLELNSTDTGW